MSTKWVVTAASERIVLDQKRQGETTFTVTNPSGSADRAVFDVVPAEDADSDWFSVEDPQRLVRPGASVAYLMKVAVPAGAPPGSFGVQARVYSVDSAPEESSVLSPRVVLEVPEPAPEQPKRFPWWLVLVAAGVAVVLLIVVGWLVFRGGDDEAPPPAPGEVSMPDLNGLSEQRALATLAELGLTVRPIRYRHILDATDTVVRQSVTPGTVVDLSTVVDLEVAVSLSPPGITGPPGVAIMVPGDAPPIPTLEWESPASVRSWRVFLFLEECRLVVAPVATEIDAPCQFPAEATASVPAEAPTLTPELTFNPIVIPVGTTYHSGWVQWQVAAVDDFGTAGPTSEFGYFRVSPRQP
jgi:hypothetical protein